MKSKFLLGAAMLALALLLSACTSPWQQAAEKSAENTAENAIEDSTGGNAEVDINTDQGSVSINSDQGSMQAGENVSMPDDFPDDIYVYEGKLSSVFKTAENNGYSLTIQTIDPVSTVKDAYQNKLEADGWTIQATMDYGTTASIVGEKDNRTVSIVIGSGEDNSNNVVITTGENK